MMGAFDFVVFDIETTGLDPAHDQIAEIAAIKCDNGSPGDYIKQIVH